VSSQGESIRNPHFDDGLVIWDDAYSGRYSPPPQGYENQFDLQWKLALERFQGYEQGPGVRVDDENIDDRIYELTGVHPRGGALRDTTMGARKLDVSIDTRLIAGKRCIDIGCGLGRWTRVMQKMGAASVTSVDMSPSALESVRRFNTDVRVADVTKLSEQCPDLVGQFDFATFWGVAMCTHDPLKAFLNAASTVRPGGGMYLMVYCPEGMHGTAHVVQLRKRFHAMKTVEERLAFVEHVFHRRWDSSYPPIVQLKNVIMNVLHVEKHSINGVLDMLSPFFNWVIPLSAIDGWMKKAGFAKWTLLNVHERKKCAYHVLGIKGL
jgi:SAM-dependent methyltransferase